MPPRKKIPSKKAAPKKVAAMPKRTTLDILNDWTQRGLYVYLRAVSSKWEDKQRPHVVVWKVSVEYRNVEFFRHQAQSRVTPDAAIQELDKIVPPKVEHDSAFVDKRIAAELQGGGAKRRRKKITR
jgi:hypothetical protein